MSKRTKDGFYDTVKVADEYSHLIKKLNKDELNELTYLLVKNKYLNMKSIYEIKDIIRNIED